MKKSTSTVSQDPRTAGTGPQSPAKGGPERNPIDLTKTTKPLFVSLLLDETGSMMSIKGETIQAYNRYLASLKETRKDAEILFSLVTFNSSDTKTRVVADPVRTVRPLTDGDYQPNHMTPLIDAAVKIIRATDEAVAARDDDSDVVVAIQTDGLENCSVEFDAGDLAQLVKEKEEAGWQFIFLGAGLDAFEAAHLAGIQLAEDRVLSYDRALGEAAMGIMEEKTRAFYNVRNAQMMDIVAEDRQRAGDRWHKPNPADTAGQASATPAPAKGREKKRDRRSSIGDISLT